MINATTATPTPKPIQTPSTKKTIIYIRNNTFVPTELTVLPGTGITWVNEDGTVHAVKTTGDHAGMFNSGDIIPGGRWGYTFGEREGTFEFTNPYHPEMTGTIVVKKGQSVYGAPTMQSTATTP
jgi:plastocyanin